jgi:hypothetical protein
MKRNLNSDGQQLNLLSPQLTEHKKKPMTYEMGNPESGLGQAQKCVVFKPFNGIQTLYY